MAVESDDSDLRATVPARAALAGNPSDGYGGAVASVIVPGLHATVSAEEALHPTTELPLLAAARARFRSEFGEAVGQGLQIDTNIPRSVGLAGSSAIVVGALRVHAMGTGVALGVDDLARLAHAVERVDLGIPGGWQDQIVQSHGESLLMDFAADRHEPLDAAAGIPLYVAWTPEIGESSAAAHATLAADVAGDESRQQTMRELADLARQAAAALRSRDVHELKSAISATFDLRRTVMALQPAHVALVETARSLGAAANYAGSGGAISGVVPKDEGSFRAGMQTAGYELITWTTA